MDALILSRVAFGVLYITASRAIERGSEYSNRLFF